MQNGAEFNDVGYYHVYIFPRYVGDEFGWTYGNEVKTINSKIVERIRRQIKVNILIGKIVTVTVDRPLGSYHPKHKDMYYPINYGYIEGTSVFIMTFTALTGSVSHFVISRGIIN